MNKLSSKTLSKIKIVSCEFVIDESGSCESRTEEVRELLTHMIEAAKKRGRPSKAGNDE